MSRDDRVAPPTSNTIWFSPIPTRRSSAPACCAIRASSWSARAGTFASKDPSSSGSRRVSLTLSRYESVATMRSSPPDADTRMPVSTGRVSSREAERATVVMVSTKASPGTVTALSA